MRYSFVKSSSNIKTGPIPVTMTERASCPDSCALKKAGCYAESGNVRIHWQRLDNAGLSLDELAQNIRKLPKGQLFRHNVAGDLTSAGLSIDYHALQTLTDANKGRRGFTYTHAHDTTANRDAIKAANAEGFTVNLSANSPEHADELAEHGIGPVVTLVDIDAPTHSKTPAGRPIIVCPAVRMEGMDCAQCQLCQKVDRHSIVGFPVHGTSKRKAANVIRMYTREEVSA